MAVRLATCLDRVVGETLQSIGKLTPLHHAVVLIQDPWLGFGWNMTETLVVIAFLAGSAGLTFLLLRYPYWPLRIKSLFVGRKRTGPAPRATS